MVFGEVRRYRQQPSDPPHHGHSGRPCAFQWIAPGFRLCALEECSVCLLKHRKTIESLHGVGSLSIEEMPDNPNRLSSTNPFAIYQDSHCHIHQESTIMTARHVLRNFCFTTILCLIIYLLTTNDQIPQ